MAKSHSQTSVFEYLALFYCIVKRHLNKYLAYYLFTYISASNKAVNNLFRLKIFVINIAVSAITALKANILVCNCHDLRQL